jgi:hypothetical protein
MTTIQSRRKLIVVILLCVAVVGAVMRHYGEPGSTYRNVGTLLMLIWLPVVGNIVGWLMARIRRPAAPAASALPAFVEPGTAFRPHALAELTLRPAGVPAEDLPIHEGEHRCALVVDNQGFSVRWVVPQGEPFRRGKVRTVEVEFLAPEAALPVFRADTAFRMLVGESFIGDGRIVRLSGPSL